MSCQHGEERFCNQYCLEKETKTNDGALATTTKRVIPEKTSPPTMTARQKRISILVDSSLLAAGGALWYLNNKVFLKMATVIFDSILDVIGRPTE